jgi:GNAT superfamily N-acetyltransferase
MSVEIVSLEDLPETFATLRAAADTEGYDFMERLQQNWSNGAYRRDLGATLRAAYVDGDLAGLGAQALDEYDVSPDHRRIRHFYVLPKYRRDGVGRALAQALIDDALALSPRLHLRATHEVSLAFWDALGFSRVSHENRTHEMVRR